MSAPRAGGDRDGRTVNSAIADDDSALFGAVLATDAEPIVAAAVAALAKFEDARAVRLLGVRAEFTGGRATR